MTNRISLFALAAALLAAMPARADTVVTGNINTDTHWTTAGSPYVIRNDLTIAAAATLTIDPGVTVKADVTSGFGSFSGGQDSARMDIIVQGRLLADASAGSPIVFTSTRATPASGDWYGIDFISTAVAGSMIKNVEIAHARRPLHVDSVPAANLVLDKLLVHHYSDNGIYLKGATTTVAVTNSEIHDQGVGSPGACLYLDGTGAATHSGLKLHHGSYGVYANETAPTVQDSQIYANTTTGIYFTRGSSTARTFELKNSVLYANGSYGVEVYNTVSSGTLTFNVTDSVVTGHTSYAFYGANSYYQPHLRYQYSDIWSNGSGIYSYLVIDGSTGSIVENPLFVAAATFDFRPTERSPLRYSDSNAVKGTIGPLEYDGAPTPGMQGVYWTDFTFPAGETAIEGDVTVAKGATVTVPAGATLRMATTDGMKGGTDTGRIEWNVKGTLVVQGTPTQQVVFTSTGTAKTDWYGIHVFPTADALTMAGTKVARAVRGLWIDGNNFAPADLESDACDTGLHASGSSSAFANLTLHDGNTGLYASGGNPQFTNVTLLNGVTGISLNATQADFKDLVVSGFTSYGIQVSEGGSGYSNAFQHCKVYDNQVGFYLAGGSSVVTVTVDHCTVAFNRSDAFQLYRTGSSYAMTLTVTASAVTNNAGYAFNGANSYYQPAASWSRSDVWKNTNGASTYVSGGAASSSFVYNPLYADPAARNFKPTHRSPLRYSDGSDKEIGYDAHTGDQTPGYHGFYWEDFQFAPGTYDVAGDLVVTARRIPGSGVLPDDPTDDVPARVTFWPGVVLKMATTDVMEGGRDTGRIEIVNHGTLEMDGITGMWVKATSGAATPKAGDWYGVVVASDAFGTNVSETESSYALFGARLETNNHIIKNFEAYQCGSGVYVEGGAPEVRNVLLHDNNIGLNVVSSTPKIYDLVAHHNTSYGVYVAQADGTTRTINVDGCMLYANAGEGGQVYQTSGSLTFGLNRCTIHGNTSHGFEWYKTVSATSTLNLANSSVTSNGGYGLYGANSYYQPSMAWSSSDVWGNPSGQYTYFSISGAGVFSYNPLFKDAANGDFTPTDRSPLRCAHQDGVQAAGYKPFVGDPTGQLMGYLHGDMTLTAAGSPYVIPGDLIVDNKCSSTPVTLTIQPGTVLQFAAKADAMGGGIGTSRTELRVLDNLVIDGSTAQAQLISGAAAPAKGDWTGVVLENGSTVNAKGYLVEWADNGFRGVTTTGNLYSAGVVRNGSGWGYTFTSGADGIFEDGLVTLNASGGISLSGITGTPVIRRTILLDNPNYDVYVQDGNVQLFNNVLMGSGEGFYGYKASGSTAITFDFYNNTIFEHTGNCIHTYNGTSYSSAMKFNGKNNLMTWCKNWAFLDDGNYRIGVGPAGWNYNNVYQTLNYTAANPYSGISKGVNDTAFDPQYEDIDPSGKRRWYDLRLLSNSPMMDAGTSGGLIPTDDLIKTARPKVTKWDIGAYEYDPGVNHDPWAAAGADLLVAQDDVTCFDASATTDPDSDTMTYAWTFGDNTGAAGKFVCHTFTSNVIHEVILTVTDEHGGVDHDVVSVDVDRRPIAEAGPEVAAAAGGDAAAFDGSQSRDVDGSITAYSWDFGDGTPPSTAVRPSHQYGPGPSKDFLVTLTVTDNDGFSSSDTTIAHVYGTTDTNGPLIVHTAIANGRPEGQAVDISATISDPSGVKSASVYYRVKGTTPWTNVAMTLLGGTTYKATIPAATITPAGVDYYIEATDNYATPNTGTLPATAPVAIFSFTVNPVDSVGPTITHTPIANGQAEGQPVSVTATVTDPSGVASVKLYYRVGGGSAYASATMSTTGDGVYKADIPAVIVTSTGVDYYIEATDSAPSANKSTAPSTAPAIPYHFAVNVSDTVGPTIVHTRVADGQLANTAVTILADITDASGVQLATLFYRTVGAAQYSSLSMTKTTGSTYQAVIPAGIVTTAGVQYYLYAQDNSAAHNATLAPATAPGTPYAFTVTSGDTSGPSIAHTPIANGQIAGQAVTIAAAVVDSSGVASVTLYYRVTGSTTWTIQAMTHGTGDSYQGIIPSGSVTTAGVQYYIKAVDGSPAANQGVAPTTAPTTPYEFTARVEDVTGPDVTHTPIRNGQVAGSAVAVTATVTDPSGVNSVTLYYRSPGASYTAAPMSLVAANTYSASIPAGIVVPPSVDYYLVAIDNATANNQTVVPGTAPTTPYNFTVTPLDQAGPVITHTPVADGQIAGRAIDVAANVTDSSGVASVELFYRVTGDSTWQTVALLPSSGGNYSAQIPGAAVTTPSMQYYLRATDASTGANVSVSPATAPTTPQAFTVVLPDTTGPSIVHTPIANGRPAGAAVTVSADVTDTSGVASVKLYFRASTSTTYAIVDMAATTGNTWQGDIPAFAVTTAGVDYYLQATDQASPANSATLPSNAPAGKYSFTVLAVDTTAPTLTHVAVSDGQPEGKAVAISAAASDASGIADVTLWYRTTGSGAYTSVALTDANGDGTYDGTIPAGTVLPAGVDYYLTATDAAPAANGATLPLTAPTTPYHFTVTARDLTPPAIVHAPIADGQTAGVGVVIDATVVDAGGVASVTLYYRVTGTTTWSSIAMPSEGGGQYAAMIPGTAVTAAGVDYYIEAKDTATPANAATAPIGAPGTPYAFTVKVPDTTPPSIVHTPVADGQEVGADVTIQATVTDASGVSGVTLWFKPLGTSTYYSVALAAQGGNAYGGTIPGYAVTSAGVAYYLQAVDGAQPPNTALLPASAPGTPFTFTAKTSDTTGPSIAHTPVADGQTAGGDVTVQATVTDVSGVAAVHLYYRADGGGSFTQVAMTSLGGGLYSATIPAAVVKAPATDYYLDATDSAAPANTSVLPTTAPATPYRFTVTTADTVGPSIVHSPIADGQDAGRDLPILATVTDASGVASVNAYYRTTGASTYTQAPLVAKGGNLYEGAIPAATVKGPGVDYYLEATDAATAANVSRAPVDAPGTPYHFTVIDTDTAGPDIVHTPIADGQPAGVDVAIQALVTDASGIASVVLHFRPAGGAWASTGMSDQGGGSYAGVLPGYAVLASGVEYYLEATDRATVPNTSVAPTTAPSVPYAFSATTTDATGPSITHQPVADGQPRARDVEVAAVITDSSGIFAAALHYRVTGGGSFTTVTMVPVGGNGAYKALIPAADVTTAGVDYYLEATDDSTARNVSFDPVAAPASYHHFVVAAQDTEGPVVTHDKVVDGQTAGKSVTIAATVSDPSGVANVTLFVRTTGTSEFTSLALVKGAGTSWQVVLPGAMVVLPGLDYYLVAQDGASPSNATTVPAAGDQGPYSFTVVAADHDGPVIDHVPLTGVRPRAVAVPITAKATDPSGVASMMLYFRPSGTADFAVAAMTAKGGNVWEGTVPAYAVDEPGVEYFLEATDASDLSNVSTSPDGAPAAFHAFPVKVDDTTGPVIDHAPLADGQMAGADLTILAAVTDASGVDSVTLSYRAQGTVAWTDLDLVANGDIWSVQIPAGDVVPPGLDYFLTAVDLANPANSTLEPKWGAAQPHSFTVVAEDLAGPSLAVTPVANDRPAGKGVTVQASAEDPSGIHAVTLFYRVQGATEYQAVPMAATTDVLYQGKIPAEDVGGEAIEYYVLAVDSAAKANKTLWPDTAPGTPASFTVAPPPDSEGPSVTVDEVRDGMEPGVDVPVTATVTDPSGVSAVRLFYRPQAGGEWVSLAMAAGTATNGYVATIPAVAVTSPGVDYYVEALDGAPTPNRTVAPAAGAGAPYSFTVTAVVVPDTEAPAIVHTPPSGPLYAGEAIPITATITDASGIAAAVLHHQAPGGSWTSIPMLVDIDGTTYMATIPATDVAVGDLRYYIEARDKADPGNIARDPAGGPTSPHVLSIVEARPVEPKSSGGCDAGATGPWWPTLLVLALAGMALRRRTA